MTEEKKPAEGLALLREPFPDHQISLLPKPTKKDNPKGNCPECGKYHGIPAVHLEYVGHAALTDRLLEADPKWTWEPLALDAEGLPRFDKTGGLWIKLTVCGLTRLGYGHAGTDNFKDAGAREKEIIGDALRNAAMRFGAALDLWHKGDLHGEGDDGTKGEKKQPPQAQGTGFAPPAGNQELPAQPTPIDLGDYVIRVGKAHKGKKLKDIPPKDLGSYIDFLETSAHKENKKLTGGFLECVQVGSKYLASLENQSPNGS